MKNYVIKKTHIQILESYSKNSKISFAERDFGVFECVQHADKKRLSFLKEDLEKIVTRNHKKSNEPFLQLDFKSRPSVLVLKDFIGFRPLSHTLVEAGVLPQVVTTLDLIQVKETLETLLCDEKASSQELSFLRLTYIAILEGAEAVGFELKKEKEWVLSLNLSDYRNNYSA